MSIAIEKISFRGVDTPIQAQQEARKDETQNQLAPVDKEKSNAAKYMIGATALAAVIGLGILGRKGYLGDGVQKLLGGAKKSADDIAETGQKKGGEILDDISSKAKDTPDDVTPKSGDEIDGKASPDTTKIPDANPHLSDNIDYSDFSKIAGDIYERNGLKCKDLKNSEGKVIKTFASDDGKTLSSVFDYAPKTGNMIKGTYFREDGKTWASVVDYDPETRNKKKFTAYQPDGKTFERVSDYDTKTGRMIKRTFFREDGKTVWYVDDYAPKTGKLIKEPF